jgi:hypothetical protein
LNNDNGKQADNFINNMDCRFGIRSTGTSEQYKDGESYSFNFYLGCNQLLIILLDELD